MLDDTVTAQYTHTLTVNGRLGGLYTCTVANKHSEASESFNVQGMCNSTYYSLIVYTRKYWQSKILLQIGLINISGILICRETHKYYIYCA